VKPEHSTRRQERQDQLKSPVVKRSINLAGRKTSVSLEEPFWNAVREISASKGIFVSDLVSSINNERQHTNLSSAIRVFVLAYYRG
jgi:predicted DNA-binding ribbon-helix-helix protein